MALCIWCRAHLHAVQSGAGAADAVAVCTEAALLRQRAVALRQELATQL